MNRIEAKRCTTEVIGWMLCSKCKMIPMEAKMCLPCQIALCDVCVSGLECMKCTGALAPASFMYDHLRIYCKHHEKGCPETVPLKELREHEKTCEHKSKVITIGEEEEKIPNLKKQPAEPTRIICGDNDGMVRVWNLKTKQMEEQIKFEGGRIWCLKKLTNGDHAISSKENLFIMKDEPRKIIKRLKAHEDTILDLCEVNEEVIATGGNDCNIRLWKNDDLAQLTTFSHGATVKSLCMLSDSLIASGGRDKKIKIWDVNTSKLTNTLTPHTHWVYAIVKFICGDIISAAHQSEVKVWDSLSMKCIKTIDLEFAWSSHGLCILEGQRVAVACYDKSIRIYGKRDNYSSFISLKGHTNHINQIVSVGLNVLASASHDKTVKVWNINSETVISEFVGEKAIMSVALFE